MIIFLSDEGDTPTCFSRWSKLKNKDIFSTPMPDIMPKTNCAAKNIRKSHCSPSGVSQSQDSWWVFLFSMAFMHLWALLLDIPISPLILLTETTVRLRINKNTKQQRNLILISLSSSSVFTFANNAEEVYQNGPTCEKTKMMERFRPLQASSRWGGSGYGLYRKCPGLCG